MTDKYHDTSGITNLRLSAEQGNLLSRFQIYQYYRQGIVGSRSDIAKVNEHASHLIDEAKKSRLKLNKLSLYSFRRYKNIQIEFDKNLTVVVGENGAGKTSIVESIAKLLSWIASRTIKANNSGNHIVESDIQTTATDYAEVVGQFELNSKTPFDVSLNRAVKGWPGKIPSILQSTTLLGEMYRELSAITNEQELPVLAFYSVDRSSISISEKIDEARLKKQSLNRFNAYEDVFRNQSKNNYFIQQYIVLNNLAESGEPSYQKHLQLVNQAIESAVPDISNLHIDRNSGYTEIKLDSFDNRINFAQLSQGQKTLAAMIGDLALRMISLNPKMDIPLQASGIVLIDEIDLHLHPSLQQKIIPHLQKTFKNLQWIITTHSPHVLSTVDKESIRMIQFHEGYAITKTPEFQTRGVISSSVLEQIMGTHAIPDVEESYWVSKYQSLIQNKLWESEEAKELYSRLLKHFGTNHPVIDELNGLMRLEKLKQNYENKKQEANRA